MANQLLTISKITNESLYVLENMLTFTSTIDNSYDDQFAKSGAKIGATVNVRKPGRFNVAVGPTLSVQDLFETAVQVTLSQQAHVDTQFTTQDLSLSLDLFSQRVIRPKVAALANYIDQFALTIARNYTANQIGTAGVTPNQLITYLSAQAVLSGEAAPADDRSYVLDPFAHASIVDSLKALFNPNSNISEQYRKGMMGEALGSKWFMDQNMINHTYGAWSGAAAGSVTVNGANQAQTTGQPTTQTLNITVSGGVTINAGDTLTIGGVLAVNPQNRLPYGGGRARSFVVQNTLSAASAGNYTLTIAPAIISAGQFQNCNAGPASGATISLFSAGLNGVGVTSPQNMYHHRGAFTIATAPLPVPDGVDFAGVATDKELGMNLRVVRQYSINNDSLPTRIDCLFGVAPLYPETAIRIAG